MRLSSPSGWVAGWLVCAIFLGPTGCQKDADTGGAASSVVKPEYLGEKENLDPRGTQLSDALRMRRDELLNRPRTPEISKALGDLFFRNGHHAEAAGWYEEAIAARPTDPALRGKIATALMFDGKVDAAVKHLEACVAKHPNDLTCQFALGATLARQFEDAPIAEGSEDKRRRAVKALERVLDEAPEHPKRKQIGETLAELGAAIGK